MEHLNNLIRGMAAASEALTNRAYQSPQNGFHQDRNNLQNDVNKTINSLNQEIHKQYGKQ